MRKHLNRCQEFKKLMNATEASQRPEWYEPVKKAKFTASTTAQPTSATGASNSLKQARLTTITLLKMSKQEQMAFEFNIAMHYYMSGTSAYRIEETFFLRAIKVLRPDVQRPTRQKLLGELLDICYKSIKAGVDQLLRQLDGYCTLASDGWTDILNNSVINYNYSSPLTSLYLEGLHTGGEKHTAQFLANDVKRVMGPLLQTTAGYVSDNTSANKAV